MLTLDAAMDIARTNESTLADMHVFQSGFSLAAHPVKQRMTPFIAKFSATLCDLTKKGASFAWNPSHDKAFESAKKFIRREVTLAYFKGALYRIWCGVNSVMLCYCVCIYHGSA